MHETASLPSIAVLLAEKGETEALFHFLERGAESDADASSLGQDYQRKPSVTGSIAVRTGVV